MEIHTISLLAINIDNTSFKVDSHFRSSGHDFNWDSKFTIIERKNILGNITAILKTYENKWIKLFKTLTPNGFNMN